MIQAELRRVFELMDTDGDGMISFSELQAGQLVQHLATKKLNFY